MMFTYSCPHCYEELVGSFGDNVYCKECDRSYQTEWDYVGKNHEMAAWLTGAECKGENYNDLD